MTLVWWSCHALDSPVRRSVDTPPLHRFALNWVALFCLILVLVVAASVIMARAFWKVVPQTVRSSDPDLGMQVVFRGNNLLLTWNQSLLFGARFCKRQSAERFMTARNIERSPRPAQVAQAGDLLRSQFGRRYISFEHLGQDRKSAQLSGIVRVLANRTGADPCPSSEWTHGCFSTCRSHRTSATGAIQGRPATSKSKS